MARSLRTGEHRRVLGRALQLQITDWGMLPYGEAHRRQLAAVEARLSGRCGDTLFLVEHPHVYTHGRGTTGDRSGLPPVPFGEPVESVRVERGGSITYHGPGQLVAYPVVDVKLLTGDLHQFLRWLEEVVIRTIAEWGIEGERHSSHTGVWVEEHKVASIGVAVRRWVSYHGVALNVSTDLRYFGCIHPCGLPSAVMTSMESLTGERIALSDVKVRLAKVFSSMYHEGITPASVRGAGTGPSA